MTDPVNDGQMISPQWPTVHVEPFQTANQFALQGGLPTEGEPVDGNVYLLIGHAGPPLLLGSNEEKLGALAGLDGKIPVVVLGRFQLTIPRLRELAGLLQRQLSLYEKGESPSSEEVGNDSADGRG